MDCVADTVYLEARGEGEAGMRAVAHVIYNRARARNISPCAVVRQKNQFATGRVVRSNNRAWAKAKQIALNPGPDLTSGARYFHNYTVKPRWSYRFKVTLRLGNHIFYKP